MHSRRTYRVSEVAELSGLTVRALHHYDSIGLLTPTSRSAAGYRLYEDGDLLRLQQILIGRELGWPLEEIRRSLDDRAFDRRQALRAQRAALERRASRTAEMIRAIDAAIALVDRANDAAIVEAVCDAPRSGESFRDEGATMDMKQLFDGFDPAEHEQEARERWGHTDAYRISTERAKSYGDADWARLAEEQRAIYDDAAAVMSAGHAPDDPAALDVAERHRLSIDRWFYPCSAEMHRGIANLYEADARFAKNIDKHGAGLAAFLAAAIRANAARPRAR
jgi:DNA-binding transcriptional MerR regulator